MAERSNRELIDSLAGSAKALLASTRTIAEVHISDLKSQLDDLWKAAEEFVPATVHADLSAHVERTLDELKSWTAIGLRKGFST